MKTVLTRLFFFLFLLTFVPATLAQPAIRHQREVVGDLTVEDALSVKTLNGTRYVNKYADAGAGTVASPWTGWEDAFASIPTTGLNIVFPPGHYTQSGGNLVLPVNLTGTLTISGYGAKIKLTSSYPRFLDIGRTADNQTLQHIVIEGMTIDADNIGGKHHVVVGDYQTDSRLSGECLNMDDITIRDVTTENVLSGDSAVDHRLNIFFAMYDDSGPCPQSPITITDVFIERNILNGGNVGIVVSGTGSTPSDVYMDNIQINDNYHDRGGTASTFYTSSNFHFGSRGYGGYIKVSGNVGKNSADVGIEVNGFLDTFVSDNYIENAYMAAYLITNYSDALDVDRQTIQLMNNSHSLTDGVTADNTRRGVHLTAAGIYDLGHVLVSGHSGYTNTTVADGDGWCYRMISDNTESIASVTVRDLRCEADSLNDSSGAATTFNAVEGELDGTPGTNAILDGIRVILRGTDGAGTHTMQGVRLYGDSATNYTVKNIECDFNVTSADTNSQRCLVIGSTAASPVNTLAASVSGVKIIQMTGSTNPRAIVMGGSNGTGTTYAEKVVISNSDFSGLPAGGVEVLSTDADTDYILVNNRNKDGDIVLYEDIVGDITYDVSASDVVVTGVSLGETLQTLDDSGTPTVGTGNVYVTGGTTTITDFVDGIVGQRITVSAAHAVTLTHNASNIVLSGATNFDMLVGDTITFEMFTLGVWTEVARSLNYDADGIRGITLRENITPPTTAPAADTIFVHNHEEEVWKQAEDGRSKLIPTRDRYLRTTQDKPMVTLRFDDGDESGYDLVAPLLESYGFRGTFTLITEELGTGSRMTLAEAVELYNRGHEIGSHGNPSWITESASHCKAAGDPYTCCTAAGVGATCGTFPTRVHDLHEYYVAQMAWARTNLNQDRLPIHFIPYGDHTKDTASQCDDGRTSEKNANPCRAPMMNMLFDYASRTAATTQTTYSDFASRTDNGADFICDVATANWDAAECWESTLRGINIGGGGGWVQLGFHDFDPDGTAGSEPEIDDLEELLVLLRAAEDDGQLVVVTYEEAVARLFQGRGTNHVINPSVQRRLYTDTLGGTPSSQVTGWSTSVTGDCATYTGTYTCVVDEPDWPDRNMWRFNGAVTGRMTDLEPGVVYTIAALAKFPSGTSTNGIRIEVNYANGYGDGTVTEISNYAEPGNGSGAGSNQVGQWYDDEWGLIFTRFRAWTPVATFTLTPSVSGAEYVLAKWFVAYPIGWDASLGSASGSYPWQRRSATFEREVSGTSSSIADASSECIAVSVLNTSTAILQDTYGAWPTRFLVSRVELTKTAGVGEDIAVEFHSTSSCADSPPYWASEADNQGAFTATTANNLVYYPGVYVQGKEAGEYFAYGSNSNTIYMEIHNDTGGGAAATTVDWTLLVLPVD